MSANRKPFEFVTNWLRRQKNESYLRKWANRRDGDPSGKYYIKRHYELNFAFYDLYWYIKSTATRQRVYTHYLRAPEEKLIATIKDVEDNQLPALLEQIDKGGGI